MTAETSFGIATLMDEIEQRLVDDLALVPLALPTNLAARTGIWKQDQVHILTRAYRGPRVRFARFVQLVGAKLEIGNAVCLSDAAFPVPILGLDLVAVGHARVMIVADLSPTLPVGAAREQQLAAFADLSSRRVGLPAGEPVPDWSRAWLSPYALYVRPTLKDAEAVVAELGRMIALFASLLLESRADQSQHTTILASQASYAQAHRTDDPGLRMLQRMFGEEWSARYLSEVLFPVAWGG